MACRKHDPVSLVHLPPAGPLQMRFYRDQRVRFLSQHVVCTSCGREGYVATHTRALDWSRKPTAGIRALIAAWNAEVEEYRRSPHEEELDHPRVAMGV